RPRRSRKTKNRVSDGSDKEEDVDDEDTPLSAGVDQSGLKNANPELGANLKSKAILKPDRSSSAPRSQLSSNMLGSTNTQPDSSPAAVPTRYPSPSYSGLA